MRTIWSGTRPSHPLGKTILPVGRVGAFAPLPNDADNSILRTGGKGRSTRIAGCAKGEEKPLEEGSEDTPKPGLTGAGIRKKTDMERARSTAASIRDLPTSALIRAVCLLRRHGPPQGAFSQSSQPGALMDKSDRRLLGHHPINTLKSRHSRFKPHDTLTNPPFISVDT